MKLIAAVAQTATVLFDTAATVGKAETLPTIKNRPALSIRPRWPSSQ